MSQPSGLAITLIDNICGVFRADIFNFPLFMKFHKQTVQSFVMRWEGVVSKITKQNAFNFANYFILMLYCIINY